MKETIISKLLSSVICVEQLNILDYFDVSMTHLKLYINIHDIHKQQHFPPTVFFRARLIRSNKTSPMRLPAPLYSTARAGSWVCWHSAEVDGKSLEKYWFSFAAVEKMMSHHRVDVEDGWGSAIWWLISSWWFLSVWEWIPKIRADLQMDWYRCSLHP